MSANILIIEDESAIRAMVGVALRQAGLVLREAADAQQAKIRLREELPDLVLLDWMLPGISGVDFARQLRQDPRTRGLPIIMLTARTEEADKIRGLDSGADDYITKPFSPRELLARIRALLRRSAPESTDAAVQVRGLSLDPSTHRVEADGRSISLGPLEFRLLHYFMSRPERVHSRERILNGVWGENIYIEERTVDVHIRRLRKALAGTGYDSLIETVRGAGYRFTTQV